VLLLGSRFGVFTDLIGVEKTDDGALVVAEFLLFRRTSFQYCGYVEGHVAYRIIF
jgi:hypothetical protein